MINTIAKYRKILASLLAIWMGIIVISGIVFMHKEVTSDGQIITHIHPYDFTKKKNNSHHKNDAEIRFLDIVFQGSFTEPTFHTFSAPIRASFEIIEQNNYFNNALLSHKPTHYPSRGPPSVV